jgi:hypothetical protein
LNVAFAELGTHMGLATVSARLRFKVRRPHFVCELSFGTHRNWNSTGREHPGGRECGFNRVTRKAPYDPKVAGHKKKIAALVKLLLLAIAKLNLCGPAYFSAFAIVPKYPSIPIDMDKSVAQIKMLLKQADPPIRVTASSHPVVTIDKMHDGLFIHFADGRFAFYTYNLLYAIIETAQVVSPEMNDKPLL